MFSGVHRMQLVKDTDDSIRGLPAALRGCRIRARVAAMSDTTRDSHASAAATADSSLLGAAPTTDQCVS